MKEKIMNFFNHGNLGNKALVKLWDEKNSKWYFEIVDIKKQEREAIISYNELVSKKSK